jgi:hypothetical protein
MFAEMNATDLPERTATKYIWMICSPILLIFGAFGNILSVVVLNRPHRTRTSTSTYLTTLAVCDLFVLIVGLLRQWVRATFDFDIRNINDSFCKVHFYLVNFLLQFSSWILVAITIERVKSVRKPHMAKVGCTRKLASWVLLAEVIVLMVLNGHSIFGVKIRIVNDTETNSSVCRCEPDNENDTYSRFMYYVWTWIDFVIVFFLPFLILMTANILIIINVKRSRRFQRGLINHTSRHALNAPQKPLIPMTAMLLTLNSVFFVCVGPVNVYSIGQFHWWPEQTEGHTLTVQLLLWVIVNILMYTNNAVNFLLYIMCGSEFRTEVKAIFLTCCQRKAEQSHKQVRNPAKLNNQQHSTNTSFEMISV